MTHTRHIADRDWTLTASAWVSTDRACTVHIRDGQIEGLRAWSPSRAPQRLCGSLTEAAEVEVGLFNAAEHRARIAARKADAEREERQIRADAAVIRASQDASVRAGFVWFVGLMVAAVALAFCAGGL